MRTTTAALACCILGSLAAYAQPAVVEAVQYPAWLDRGGHAVPLMPGMQLAARDRLRTGGNARVQLKLSEGSAVKLGENAQFVIERVDDRGAFQATLAVIAGAFRFTTNALAPRRAREVSVKVKNVTVGIRGTDLWGKSTDERDLVCLIEGKVSVGSQGHPTVTLDQPLDFYQKPRDGVPAVAKVDQKQLDEWSLETELSKDGAAATAGGRWRVVAALKPKRDQALALRGALRGAGYPAEIVAKDGYFLVQVGGLTGERAARALMANLRGMKGVALPTVHEGP